MSIHYRNMNTLERPPFDSDGVSEDDEGIEGIDGFRPSQVSGRPRAIYPPPGETRSIFPL